MLVGGVTCLVDSVNERDLHHLIGAGLVMVGNLSQVRLGHKVAERARILLSGTMHVFNAWK